MNKVFTVTALSAVLLSGCASIIGDNTQTIPITSTPSKASVLITDEAGKQVFQGATPTSVTLQKSSGSYFGGKNFIIQIDKEGYETQLIPVKARANGWYIAGNLFFGGLIGWLIVDPFNGGMYTLSPDDISSSLDNSSSATTTHNNTGNDGSITVVLLNDVPEHLRGRMEKIN